MKPAVLVTRRIFDDVAARLRAALEVETNDADDLWAPDELRRRLQGKDGVFVTGTERIDGALLDACPQLRAMLTSVAVGFMSASSAAPTRWCDAALYGTTITKWSAARSSSSLPT